MNPFDSTTTAAPASLASRMNTHTLGAATVVTLPTPVESVVTWRGSFTAYPDFANGEELLQDLTVALLDSGTRKRDRFELAETLDELGAQLDFQSNGLQIRMLGRCLRHDVATVVGLMAEQLREPNFTQEEFEKVKAQLGAGIRRAMDSTANRASSALVRLLYAPGQPNYSFQGEEELRALDAMTLADVEAYHQTHFGADDLRLVFVGDLDEALIEKTVRHTLGDWERHEAEPAFVRPAPPTPPGRVEVPMPDKANLDIRFGHTLPITREHPDFLPLFVGNYILGGNFSARLMAIVRDELGLTYGIRSGLAGVERAYEGHWQVGVTLSRDALDRGIDATLGVISDFVQDGITPDELAEKQATITGSFQVGLATTGGLALAVLVNLEREFGLDYLDQYPKRIDALTTEQVNAAIQTYLDPDRLHLALAGTR